MPLPIAARDRVLRAAADARDELVDLTRRLIAWPTVNPPGACYEPCARWLGDELRQRGYTVDLIVAEGRSEHTAAYPRVNVVGRRPGVHDRPTVHFNGHIDVVPVGEGWTVDPFAGVVRDGRVYGRGAADMKGGLAAAIVAADAVHRAGVRLAGSVEVSGTVDEETGGFAGVAHLAGIGRLTSARVDTVIIPEPLNVDRICIGHRGVYWFDVITRGAIAHGSMPHLGVNAIEQMGEVLHAMRAELLPRLAARRTAMPVVPDESRHATLNVNTVQGGQVGEEVQSPCVADRCHAIFDRRFLAEEGFEATRAEVVALLEALEGRIPRFAWELVDRLVVHPVVTPTGSPVVTCLQRAIRDVLGRDAALVASPGTYDHKHVTRIGGINDCVAYGPGILELSHQPDEWVGIDDLVQSAQVMALALCELAGTA
jgi:succinyl-diaminopimelate desuccinylase